MAKKYVRYVVVLLASALTCFHACAMAHADHLAPVITLMPDGQRIAQSDAPLAQDNQIINPPTLTQPTYTVKKGDTLYSIAFLAGKDYEELAVANNISAPYTLAIGQVLQLSSKHLVPFQPLEENSSQNQSDVQTIYWSMKKKDLEAQAPAAQSLKITNPPVLSTKQFPPEDFPTHAGWQWPVKGRILAGFSLGDTGNHGINIAGHEGTPIKASCAGQVVYSDNRIPGYGNMIIVKNTKHFLSAYAYNAKNLVQNGQWVKQGQIIATMGRHLSGTPMLHFEIRLYGKAVNPMHYLPS